MRPRLDVLLIEPDAALRDALTFMLRDAGCEVSVTSNGATGLRVALASVPALLVLDVRLPELSGSTIVQELRTRRSTSRVPIVVMTASLELPSDWLRSECEAVLLKPFDFNQFVETIFQTLSRASLRQASTTILAVRPVPVVTTSLHRPAARTRTPAALHRSD